MIFGQFGGRRVAKPAQHRAMRKLPNFPRLNRAKTSNVRGSPNSRCWGRISAVPGAERFFTQIALARVSDPLRPRAMKAFDEFFFSRARDIYPKYDFARMDDTEFGAALGLDL